MILFSVSENEKRTISIYLFINFPTRFWKLKYRF